MSRIVLCVENGNPYLEEAKRYLELHDCKVYTLSKGMEDLKELLEEIAQKEGRIDVLLLCADGQMPPDGAIGEGHDYEKLLDMVSGQISGMQQAIEEALPLLRKGELKRIGMITNKNSSISNCRADRNYGQHMTWAGFNMVGKLYFNQLRPEGFTFRWYCPERGDGGMQAGEYLLSNFCYDEKEPSMHSDENRLVMRDAYLREIGW